MAAGLSQIATDMIATLGYGGLAFGLFVDSFGIPIPSEVLLPLAGAAAKQGQMNLLVVIIVGTLAQTLGAILAYAIGMGPGLGFVKRYGKYVLFSEHELEKTHALFEKYGSWLTLFGRCLPGIRTYIGIPAGMARMKFTPFVIASFVGSLIWTVFLSVIGYQLAEHLHVIDSVLSKFGYVLALGGIVAFIWYVHHSVKKRKKQA
jgi:membrane protein DedA with SNARE-associated domain